MCNSRIVWWKDDLEFANGLPNQLLVKQFLHHDLQVTTHCSSSVGILSLTCGAVIVIWLDRHTFYTCHKGLACENMRSYSLHDNAIRCTIIKVTFIKAFWQAVDMRWGWDPQEASSCLSRVHVSPLSIASQPAFLGSENLMPATCQTKLGSGSFSNPRHHHCWLCKVSLDWPWAS